ncbi:hypothetical protein HOY80DRAFT_1133906 [Tuber brumale]|nr:hypothetical protein HOY80DRAFT_1133906 [Tuber brumale]
MNAVQYTSPDKDYDGPSLDPVLRSLNLMKDFQTSLDSIKYVPTEVIQGGVPGIGNTALFPTESGFNLTFGGWYSTHTMVRFMGRGTLPSRTGMAIRDCNSRMDEYEYNTEELVREEHFKEGIWFNDSMDSISEERFYFRWPFCVSKRNIVRGEMTNKITPSGGIAEGGLVHITIATDEVLIQFGGRSGRASITRPFSWIEIYGISKSNGIPSIYYLERRCPDLDSRSAPLSDQLLTVPAIKSKS